MITFLHLGRYGRLGNQLFQYAALKSIALENDYECKIPDPATMRWHGQECLLNELNIEAPFLKPEDIQTLAHQAVEPSHHEYYPAFHDLPDNTNIHGFFQSTYYFENYKNQIRKELTPDAQHMDEAAEYLSGLRSKGQEVVSVHLRRGDLCEQGSDLNFYGNADIFDKSSIYGNYLDKALGCFKDRDVVFLVFTGGSRSGDDTADIEWAKRSFHGEGWHVADSNDPIKDLSLIASCDHNIVCHLSTFGWWGAYLNQNDKKITIAPRDYYFDQAAGYERAGFMPEEWRLV